MKILKRLIQYFKKYIERAPEQQLEVKGKD